MMEENTSTINTEYQQGDEVEHGEVGSVENGHSHVEPQDEEQVRIGREVLAFYSIF